MRTLLVWLLISFAVSEAVWAQSYIVDQFEVTPNETGAVIEIRLNADTSGSVRIPVEGLVFQTGPREKLSESDLFDSGLSLDVTGDGDTDDTVVLSRRDGKDYVESTEVRPFAETLELHNTGRGEVYQLNPSGPKFLVYQTRPELLVGLSYNGVEAGFIDVPSPSLQLLLIEECDAPGEGGDLRLLGETHTVFAYERGLNTSENRWHRVQWQTLPTNSKHQVLLEGHGKALVLVMVNYAPEPGVRQRKIVEVQDWEF